MTALPTAERLEQYYPFSTPVVDAVAESFERQATYGSYQEFFSSVGMPEPEPYHPDNCRPTRVVDIRRPEESSTLVWSGGAGVPLDSSELYGLAVLAHANPTTRIVAFEKPSNLGNEYGSLTWRQIRAVAKGGFKIATEAAADYVMEGGIEAADLAGGSMGADLSAGLAEWNGFRVPNLITLESTSDAKRRLFRPLEGRQGMLPAFKASGALLNHYVELNELPNLIQARVDASTHVAWYLGLLRPSNIALTVGATQGTHAERVACAMAAHPEMRYTKVHGGKSEITSDDDAQATYAKLVKGHGDDRVKSIRLPLEGHAMGNDLALQTAAIMQARLRP